MWLSMEAKREPSRGISHKLLQAQTGLIAAVVPSLAGVSGFFAIIASAGKCLCRDLGSSLSPHACYLDSSPRVQSEGLLSS